MRANGQAVYMKQYNRLVIHKSLLVCIVLAIVLASGLGYAIYWGSQQRLLPIKKIHALGQFSHIEEPHLRDRVSVSIDGGYFTVDVERVKKAVESLPWVAVSSVRRVWPDTLAIEVLEQQALAVWAKGGLVNEMGVIFEPDKKTYPENLPLFNGPAGLQKNMIDIYHQSLSVLAPLKLELTELKMDARRAIAIRLSNGISVLLGRENTRARLERFARVYYKVLAQREHDIAAVDMRYSNGLSIRWKKHNSG